MKFIEVKCVNRETTVNINIEHIVLLNRMIVAGSSRKEACHIILSSANDNKGPVMVLKSVSEIKKLITAAKD